jgi:hypothetical protein
MSILRINMKYTGSKGTSTLATLFDSGASLSCIHPDKVNIERINTLPFPLRVNTASADHFMEISHTVSLNFELNGVALRDEFLLIPNLSEEAIIGAATMQKWRIKLNFETDTVEVDPKVAKLQLV